MGVSVGAQLTYGSNPYQTNHLGGVPTGTVVTSGGAMQPVSQPAGAQLAHHQLAWKMVLLKHGMVRLGSWNWVTSMVNVVRPCWISEIKPFNGMECGTLVRMGNCVVYLMHLLLHTMGSVQIGCFQNQRLELSSIWALLAAFEEPLPLPGTVPFEGAFVKGSDSVSWMANNSKKLVPSQSSGPSCWTFLSTAAYGKRNKVPQENIPAATSEKVKGVMFEGVEAALGLSKGSLQKPFYTRIQLWGAALPTNSLGIPCIFDPQGRAGICGDWLLGSNVEAAARCFWRGGS